MAGDHLVPPVRPTPTGRPRRAQGPDEVDVVGQVGAGVLQLGGAAVQVQQRRQARLQDGDVAARQPQGGAERGIPLLRPRHDHAAAGDLDDGVAPHPRLGRAVGQAGAEGRGQRVREVQGAVAEADPRHAEPFGGQRAGVAEGVGQHDVGADLLDEAHDRAHAGGGVGDQPGVARGDVADAAPGRAERRDGPGVVHGAVGRGDGPRPDPGGGDPVVHLGPAGGQALEEGHGVERVRVDRAAQRQHSGSPHPTIVGVGQPCVPTCVIRPTTRTVVASPSSAAITAAAARARAA
ncbi:hypothetical protein [Ornithinimicrobium kibberense]|uniref:hypothetical protein n=1 Tax=Ornithinimicrobium kibberense TaxID=282060 RepID=UPI003605E268